MSRDFTYSGWIYINIIPITRPIYRTIPYWNSSTFSDCLPDWKHIKPNTKPSYHSFPFLLLSPDRYSVLFHIGIVRHFQTVYPTGNTSSQTPSRVITVFLFCYCLKCLLWIPIVERKMTWLEMGVDVLI